MAMAKPNYDSKHEAHLLADERLLFSQLSTFLIFNLAMTQHLMAVDVLTSGSESSTDTTGGAKDCELREWLLKACRLYGLAFSIPQNEPYLDIVRPDMLALFVRATLNNLGQCYASLEDTKNSVQCFELLLKSIMLVQQDHIFERLSEEDELSNQCQNDITFCFWRNTLFLMLKDPGFAPAA
jgi:hypothetical protein